MPKQIIWYLEVQKNLISGYFGRLLLLQSPLTYLYDCTNCTSLRLPVPPFLPYRRLFNSGGNDRVASTQGVVPILP